MELFHTTSTSFVFRKSSSLYILKIEIQLLSIKNSMDKSCKLHLPRLNMLDIVNSLSVHSGSFILVFQTSHCQ